MLFEMSLIPILIVILGWGYQVERIQASIYLLIYTMFFSLPFLGGLIFFIFNTNNFIFNTNNFIFNKIFSLIFFCVFLVKFPIYFFHLWLPKAHVEAPVSGSIILASILLKIGVFGVVRILSFIFLKKTFLMFFFTLGFIGSLIRILICLFQSDQKSLIAYSSINHITIVFFCVFIIYFLSFKLSILLIFTHGLISRAIFNYSNLSFEKFSSRNIYFSQGLLIFSPLIILFLSITIIINFRVPPFFRFFVEVIIFICFVNVNFFLRFFLIILLFFSCYYSLILYNISSHGKLIFFIKYFIFSVREKLTIFIYLNIIVLFLPIISFFF
jgi:NADH-ubiquinone oxidoreductase chain 4